MRTLVLFLATLGAFVEVQGFTFTSTSPTQCGDLQISWAGGQPPFVLQLVPVWGTQTVFNIPTSAFSNGVGSFSTQLLFAQEQQFLITMSDATGFATGGISPLLTVEAPIANATCNTADTGPAFFYSLDVALQQCRPYTFSAYPKAIQPVTIYGMVPGGTGIVLHPPNGSAQFVWSAANVPAGTSIIFAMSDAQNRTGGSSDIKVSGSTNDNSCLTPGSPSVTSQITSTSASSVVFTSSAITSTANPHTSSSSGKVSGTTIAATIAGALVGLGVLAALGGFLVRRHRGNSFRRRGPHLDLDGAGGYHDSPSLLPVPYEVEPFPVSAATGTPYEMSHMESSAASLVPAPLIEPAVEVTRPSSSFVPSSRSRKTTITTSTRYQPARFVLHTDAEEIEPDENGIIELPPQYSEKRGTLPSHRAVSDVPTSSQLSHPP
ncbi:hypothetical protein B0F90DRAFT_79118 [Multifurca ochricompacta]|uniref:Uncharacterized protein n=1 Tax=Multifurca ochricompacta TaxID=376703 RepID=A0AAD4QTM6_9AGAM|nr:hypothetical protein B0F90DRAFT_79118 [Multifurca ochricompacta]